MMFSEMELALMSGGHSLEGYKKTTLTPFIKELHEARLIRTRGDLKFSYTEVCEHLYLIILSLEFLSRLKNGQDIAKKYARATASYINYSEFKTTATDLYNLIYFVQETPENVGKIFSSEDAKTLRMKTQLPRMELNRWLLKLTDPNSKDLYFFMRIEQALNITSSEIKEVRRILSFKNPSESDLKSAAYRILNIIRFRMPLLDIRQDLETILSGSKLDYIR